MPGSCEDGAASGARSTLVFSQGLLLNDTIAAALLGLVEGITEFLPVSSTGHLILANSLLQFTGPDFSKEKADVFEIVIQAGAIGRDGDALILDMGDPVRID